MRDRFLSSMYIIVDDACFARNSNAKIINIWKLCEFFFLNNKLFAFIICLEIIFALCAK